MYSHNTITVIIINSKAASNVCCPYNAYGDTQGSNMGENLRQVSKEIRSEQIPKSTIAALMPGSESNYGQTAKHRQYCVNVARLGSTQL